MQKEKRPLRSTSLNRHQGSVSTCLCLFLESIGELFYGWSGKQSGEGDMLSKDLLNASDKARYSDLARSYGLSDDATRIVCSFQSAVAAKCYENWDDVMTVICDHWAHSHPSQRLEFFIACGPDDDQPVRREDLAAFFAGFTGAEGNTRVIVETTPSLRDLAILLSHAALCLSNDTGPGHLAGALHIPTVTAYLPGEIYPMRVWASTLWHRGVTLPPDAFTFAEIENAILNSHTDIINSVPAELLTAKAICALETQPARRQ